MAHPTTTTSLAATQPNLAKEWHPSLNELTPEQVGAFSHKKVWWLCSVCSHEWETKISSRSQGHGCRKCYDSSISTSRQHQAVTKKGGLTITHPELALEWNYEKNGPLTPESVSYGSKKKVWWACQGCGLEWNAVIKNRTGNGAGCPVCSRKQQGLNYAARALAEHGPLTVTHPLVAADWHPTKNSVTPDQVTFGGTVRADWLCSTCGHEWRALVSSRASSGRGCPNCASTGPSRGENELAEFVASLGFTMERGNRKILGGKELDIYIPEKQIAIEFNGLYWHSEVRVGKDYHYNKFVAAREAGVQLIQIWEDDWSNHPARVESLIKYKLGIGGAKVGARKLDLVELTPSAAMDFFNEHHLQGGVGATQHYGLVDGEGIQCAISVGVSSEIYIARFASACTVQGGFSKLLTHVRNQFPSLDVVTFSHNDISDGGVYSSNGFHQEYDYTQEFYYVKDGVVKREHRSNYQKHKFKGRPDLLWEEGLTERQLAELNGLYRVYTSGNAKWRLPV